MASNPKPRRRPNYPLWIIAISIMVIAICLVIDVVQRRREPEDQLRPATSDVATKESPATNSRGQFRVRSSRAPTTLSARAAEQTDTATVGGEVLSTAPSRPVATEPVSGPGAAGGFAPIAISPDALAAGEVAGRVRLQGKPPPETRINLSVDPASARLHPEPLFTRDFVVSSSGGLADAVVAVEGVKSKPAVPTNIVIIQFTNCQVEPFVSVAVPGQKLRFENASPLSHRFRVMSSRNPIDKVITLSTKGESYTISTSTNQTVFIQCANHPWETATVWLMNYATVTDRNGDFRIQGIPPGEYLVGSSHGPSTNFNFRPAIVSPGQLAAVNFSVDAPRR